MEILPEGINYLGDVQQEDDVRESTMQDYAHVVNAMGIQFFNPETRINRLEDQTVPWKASDPEIAAIFDAADIETQKEMLTAASPSHAAKIAARREIQMDSQKAVSQDPLLTQIGMSLLPATISPSSAIPYLGAAGAVFKLGRMANTVSKSRRAIELLGTGATAGAAYNLTDEYMFDVQGMQVDYLSAGALGAVFGGGLFMLGGALTGQFRDSGAYVVSKEGDTLTKDFDMDPSLTIKDVNGVSKITDMAPVPERMSKMFTDYLPEFMTDFIKSDVTTLFQSKSDVLRQVAKVFVDPTVSLKDKEGNLIKQGFTVLNRKVQLENKYRKALADTEKTFFEAKKAGNETGSFNDFIQAVSSMYTKAANKQEKLVYNKLVKAIDDIKIKYKGKQTEEDLANMAKEIEEIKAKEYANTPIEFEGTDAMVKAANNFRTYYTTMLENGKKIGIEGLETVVPEKLFRPRTWNFKLIKSLPEQDVKSKIREGIEAHPNQAGMSAEEITEVVDEVYNSLIKSSFDSDSLGTTFVRSTHLPFEKMLTQRRIKVDETKLDSLIVDNLVDATGAYSYRMSGRQAIMEATGTDNVGELMAKLETNMMKSGQIATKQELQALDRTIQDIAGTLRLNQLSDTWQWTFARNLSSYNSLRLGGGFGGNQFIELMSGVFNVGIANILKSGRIGQSFKTAAKLLYTKGKVNDDFANAMMDSGYLSTALHTHRANRLADTEQGFNTGVFERGLNGLNDKYMKWNMMRYLTAVMEDLTGGAIMQEIKKLGGKNKLSSTELKRLSRYGMDAKDARRFKQELDKYYDPKQGRFELDKFDPEVRDMFQKAIDKGVSEIVIQGDSIHLPPAMKTIGPMGRLMTQFLRFPMIANEVLLRKGYTEEQGRFVAAALGSTLAFMGLKYVREQASIALGFTNDSEAKYDYFGGNSDKAITTGVLSSLNYNAPLGMLTTMYNLGATSTGFEELGRDYATNKQMEAWVGPTLGGLVPDVLGVARDIAQGDFGDTYKSRRRAASLMMFQNAPLIYEGTKDALEGL